MQEQILLTVLLLMELLLNWNFLNGNVSLSPQKIPKSAVKKLNASLGTYLIVQLHFPLLLPKLLSITVRVGSGLCTMWFINLCSNWYFCMALHSGGQAGASNWSLWFHWLPLLLPFLLKTEEKLVPTFRKKNVPLPLGAAGEKGTVHIPLFLLSKFLAWHFFIDPVTLLIVTIQPKS